jgi:glycosyltransferase involved in cell wall biosynthesis
MRILQVITSLRTGGAESLLTDLVPLLSDGGRQVDVLAFDGTETPFMRKLTDRGVRVLTLGTNPHVYRPGNILKLIPIIRQYDIIHTHNTASQLYAAVAKRLSGVRCKLVTTEHSTDNRRRHMPFLRPIDLWMYRQYDAIISISDAATKFLAEYLGDGFGINTIPNGINVDAYLHASPIEGEKKPGDVVIIMVAAFRPGKQQEVIIRALQHLPSCYKAWLVGDGIRRAECEKLTHELGLTERVRFWGVRTDVPRLLKTADIVVMSTHYEGMSLSNIEGMSCGRPFVASNVKGIREITEEAGVLFNEGDDRQLADIISRLSQDNAYRDEVIRGCLERAKEYDISRTAAGYIAIYESLTENNHP